MSKKPKRWPMWKIGLTAALCAAGSAAMFVLSVFMRSTGEELESGEARPLLDLPDFIMILGVAGVMLTVLALLWLGLRIRESRIPPWERGKKRKR
jgi:hypothetical protein